jgi:predicted Zn-dependent protease
VDSRVANGVIVVLLGMSVGALRAADLEHRAADALAAHHLVEARELYRRLAAQHPDDVHHQIWVGRVSSWLNDYGAAEAAFDQVLTADAGNVEALVGKAYVAMWQDRFAEADGLLARALAAAADDPQVHLALARNEHFQGNDRAAARHLARALALDPSSTDAQELARRLSPAPEPPGFLARLRRLFTGRS